MIFGIEAQAFLGLSVIAALISAASTIGSQFIKDYALVRSFERWKDRQLLEHTHQRYREPVALAARELSHRLLQVLEEYPAPYMSLDVWNDRLQRSRPRTDVKAVT